MNSHLAFWQYLLVLFIVNCAITFAKKGLRVWPKQKQTKQIFWVDNSIFFFSKWNYYVEQFSVSQCFIKLSWDLYSSSRKSSQDLRNEVFDFVVRMIQQPNPQWWHLLPVLPLISSRTSFCTEKPPDMKCLGTKCLNLNSPKILVYTLRKPAFSGDFNHKTVFYSLAQKISY